MHWLPLKGEFTQILDLMNNFYKKKEKALFQFDNEKMSLKNLFFYSIKFCNLVPILLKLIVYLIQEQKLIERAKWVMHKSKY